MRHYLSTLLTTAAILSASLAYAQAPAPDRPFDPREYASISVVEPTEVLVLGTAHLSGAGDGFDPAVLEPLLDRLAAFRPDIIAIETLSGESLYALRAYDGIYQTSASDFGGRSLAIAAMAQASTGLDMPAAEAKVRATLGTLSAAATPAQRRELAALFAASGDPTSALVQWWRLEPSERVARDGITGEIVEALNRLAARRDESQMIAARLAYRLSLQRVMPIDDHASDDIPYAYLDDLVAWMQSPERQAQIASPELKRLGAASRRMTSPEATLDVYRELNDPATGRLDADIQWRTLIDRKWPEVARRRLADWETRNLRMVANIREASAAAPGGRMLVIVGSAHKPWFDAYLSMMSDMQVIDARTILR